MGDLRPRRARAFAALALSEKAVAALQGVIAKAVLTYCGMPFFPFCFLTNTGDKVSLQLLIWLTASLVAGIAASSHLPC